MKTLVINTNKEKERKEAAKSLQWLLAKNPNVKRLVETFDLEINVKPTKSYNYEHK